MREVFLAVQTDRHARAEAHAARWLFQAAALALIALSLYEIFR